jgi:SAM-dependent methyltransferase
MTFSSYQKRNSSLAWKLYYFFRDKSPAEVVSTIRERGFLRLAWNVPGLYFDRRFDRRHGVDTSGTIKLRELTVESGSRSLGALYDTVPPRSCRALLATLPADARGYTFVDFGSGKGRILLLAAERPFARIVGVEFARELHEAALANVRSYRNRAQRCHRIEPQLADAADFAIPDGPCVLHFFSPFERPLLERVIENIRRSYEADPRHIVVLYITDPETHPIPMDLLQDSGFLRREPDPRLPFDAAKRYPLYAVAFQTPA